MYDMLGEVLIREKILKALAEGDNLLAIAIAWTNIFAHGDIFESGISDADLLKLYTHLDGMLKIIKKAVAVR